MEDSQQETEKKCDKKFLEVCIGPSCGGKFFSEDIFKKFKELAKDNDAVMVVKTGCMGHCELSPNMKIDGEIKTTISHDKVEEIYNSVIQ